ncbi:Fe-S oxidoreductase [Anoxybacter fermentans]|uniref:Fe-S oxidoreductase n=1 Tax=Anoxybacter fermentans TaxID=1323375 RepID=A0A3S9SWT9_9FIRM|nr:DUF512 domain-containing protein [Anoxybacter fermentans]AZR72761.1 Fe-S oxidoreductase [Anoxybacter fermentans]
MEVKKGIPIAEVKPDSIADQLGIKPGDHLISIQGQVPRDYIDFVYLTSDDQLEILIRKKNGEKWLLDLERDPQDELGIQLEGIIYDQLKECENHCIFCFVHQMPEGLRPTLSLKDDDYRFSFLQGSYITLTNLQEEDLERIKKLKLSPLYISVHATNPSLRQKIMGNKKAGKILENLRELKEAGIFFHTQIVLCPGINDGEELKRSIIDLASLRPNLLSLAIVPVGLTKYRKKLFPLTTYTPEKAEEVYQIITQFQKKFAREGENFVYLSDEFYLLTGYDFPKKEEYHGFPQLENGVGLCRLFLDDFKALEPKLPEKMLSPTRLLLVTGVLGEKVLKGPVARLREIHGLKIKILTVINQFFGENVTVAGLLTGQDLMRAIEASNPEEFDLVVLPEVVLNDDRLFIDGMSEKEFITAIPNVIFVKNFHQLIDRLLEMNLMEVKSK